MSIELKLLIKQTQQFNLQGQPVYYAGTNPQTLTAVQGTLPASRQWRNFGTFIEQTNNIDGLQKLTLTWTAQRDQNGFLVAGTIFAKKSASNSLTFEREAFDFLKAWLIDDISAPLNSVDVKVQHWENGALCGTYEDYAIKANDLAYCDTNFLCQFAVTLKQKDEILNCIKRTLISDNWQGWFQPEPANGKKHPRFSYCTEIRPNALLIIQWYFMALTVFLMEAINLIVATVINPLVFAINGIIAIINGIVSFINALGASLSFVNYLKPINPFAAIENSGGFFLEAAGCGREHPAPLIRDYITNVCTFCGVSVDATTAPIFFAETINVETSDPNRGNGGRISVNNPHYNACFLYPQVQRGVRRFLSFTLGLKLNPDTTTFYIFDNRPLMMLDQFLDYLKPLYNAEWRLSSKLVNGQSVPFLYFQRRDFFIDTDTIYDFTVNGVDRPKIVEGVCFNWNEKKYPAALKGIYDTDAADVCGNEALYQMNGILSFGDTLNNPNYEGLQDVTTKFGATKFRLDGVTTDYIFDAFQQLMNSSIISLVTLPILQLTVKPALEKYADYALLLSGESTSYPKVLIWDTDSGFLNAKAVKTWAATSGPNAGVRPPVNPVYNTNLYPWDYPGTNNTPYKHPPRTFVQGAGIIIGGQTVGIYEAADPFSVFDYLKPALLVNYPMFFEPGYQDTLWDWFHWIDDPNKHPVMNQLIDVKIALCCDDLQRLGLFGDLNNVKLAQKVKVPSQYYTDSQIMEITVSYDTSDTYGMFIEIKCQV